VIALIDYGSGNLRSVHKALVKVGAKVHVTRRGDELCHPRAIVLPGVGAFDDCLNALQERGFLPALRAFIAGGGPFLGICVGYQALFDRSQEFHSRAIGLQVFGGPVVRFDTRPGRKVPQIGWNRLEITRTECPLFLGVPDRSFVYFVHSYFPRPADDSIVATWTEYGERFASSAWRDNVFGTQFHPEKSQETGLAILRNFVRLAA
jgi:glutamine amidotransferase